MKRSVFVLLMIPTLSFAGIATSTSAADTYSCSAGAMYENIGAPAELKVGETKVVQQLSIEKPYAGIIFDIVRLGEKKGYLRFGATYITDLREYAKTGKLGDALDYRLGFLATVVPEGSRFVEVTSGPAKMDGESGPHRDLHCELKK